jgi:hypothetical protein
MWERFIKVHHYDFPKYYIFYFFLENLNYQKKIGFKIFVNRFILSINNTINSIMIKILRILLKLILNRLEIIKIKSNKIQSLKSNTVKKITIF